ncbi:hypothetical protein SAMN05443574_103331 [Haloarcula vallismortis]|uniref:Uncharacterized protein n=1 Tax=Haloarcula vallismortis TaxID=28442 RepID=A0A1H2TPA5_HALVA|nr:hypothetical protein [Haloarcula vallismortis]SDW45746.1 hypothetical protein SAMN05443574_103331 [Haloarcula vallismortis]
MTTAEQLPSIEEILDQHDFPYQERYRSTRKERISDYLKAKLENPNRTQAAEQSGISRAAAAQIDKAIQRMPPRHRSVFYRELLHRVQLKVPVQTPRGEKSERNTT